MSANSDTNEENSTQKTSFNSNVPIDDISNMTDFQSIARPDTHGSLMKLFPFMGKYVPNDSIAEFLARPRVVYSGTSTGQLAYTENQMLYDYFSLTPVQEKCKYYHLLRGTLYVKMVVTCSAYATGQVVLATRMYVPAATDFNTGLNDVNVFSLLHKTHSIIDFGTNNTAELQIPMHLRQPYTTISDTTSDLYLRDIRVVFASITDILSTQTGALDPFTYKIYLSLIDAEVSVPLVKGVNSIYTAEFHEAANGPISYPASIIANLGRSLKDVPIIGKFAYASSMIASGIGNAAVLFGFSRPRDVSDMNYPHEELVADYAGNLRTKGLTLDPQQEIPLSAEFLGEVGDNLSYANTICRWGLLGKYPLATTTTVGTSIAQINVSPCLATGFLGNTIYSPTPLCYVSQLFREWRGSIKYKIVFPANKYVRGKLRIWWVPNLVTATSYNDVSQMSVGVVLDFSCGTEATITVPWGQNVPYLPCMLMNGANFLYLNGVLSITVEEPLITPSAAYIQEVLVYMCAGDDFEFHIPTQIFINAIHRQPYDATATAWSNTVTYAPPAAGAATTVPGYDNYSVYTMEENAQNPKLTLSANVMPFSHSTLPCTMNMGERFTSLRPLLKRFYPYMNIRDKDGTAPGYLSYFIPYLPFDSDVTGNGVTNSVTLSIQTPLRYISNMFAGVRGSIRYKIMPVGVENFIGNNAKVSIYRDFDKYRTVTTTDMILFGYWPSTKVEASTGEALYAWQAAESIIVDVPHQFVSSYRTTAISLLTNIYYGIRVVFLEGWNPRVEVYNSAGEDFMPVIWNGTPIVVLYNGPYPHV